MTDNTTREPFQDDPPRTATSASPNPGTGTGFVSHVPLRRAYRGRMLAGVAAGVADYLAVDVTIVRIAFAALTVMGGAGIPLYLAGLLLIPEEGTDVSIATSLLDSLIR